MNLSFLFPKTRRDFVKAGVAWQDMQSLDEGKLPDLQLFKIQEVWRDAVADVPYYKRLVAEERAPREIGTWEDFFSIPELTREILQDCREEFVRRSGPPDLWRMTGGSTGNPVKFGVWTSEDEVVRMLKLASSGSGPLKTVVNKYQLGIFVEPDDLEEVLRGASQIIDALALPATSYELLATPALLKPDWERYERESSWEENAKSVLEKIKK